ncbi:MAG: cupin domain-containing protein [Candidatus Binatia bacterium]
MYQAKFYESIDKERITEEMRKEGFDPLHIVDPPGHLYPPHRHPETKLLVFLQGSMEVAVADQKFTCGPGDKLVIPGNAEHSAAVGPDGCVFFWSEKL